MAVGASAGTAYISVLPDTSKLAPTLRRDAAQMVRRPVQVPVTPDTRGFGRKLRGRLGSEMKASVAPMAGALGAGAVLAGFTAVRKAGSDLQETINKVGLAFGANAGEIQRWAAGSAKNMGLPKQAALDNAASFGLLFSKLGMTGKESTSMSKAMVQLAVDLGSVHNADPTQILEAQAAAFRGEYDALQRFVPAISDAAVKQEALRLGLMKTGGTLDDAGRAQAVYSLMMAQTSKEQGDFARTQDDAANAAKTNSARMADLSANLGTLLLPAITAVTVGLGNLATWIEENQTTARNLGIAIGVVTAAVLGYNAALKIIAATQAVVALATKAWAAAQVALNFVLNANPIGLVVIAIAALAAGLIYAYKHSETFRKIVDKAFDVVADAGIWMWEHALKPAFAGIVTAFKKVQDAAKFMWERVLKPTFRFLVDTWLTVAGGIVEGAATAFSWVPGIGPKLRTAADKFANFRKAINTQLGLVDDEGVNVNLKSTFTPPKGFSMHSIVGARRGYRIPGYGGGDRVPIMAEAGEAVVPKEAAREGGFQAWAGAKGIPGFRRGGWVNANLFSPAGMGRTQEGIDAEVASRTAAGLARNFRLLLGGGPGIQGALSWARSQVGKPYLWGGVGPAGYDCSGFMSAIANVVMGRSPHNRLFATGSFPASGWQPGYMPLGFSIGSRRGSPGHMAGTLGGVNVESSGGQGVHMGAGARGARDSLFGGNIWHLTGRSGKPGGHERWVGFDQGGWLQPGATMALNNTGRPEPVGFDYDELAAAIARNPPQVFLDRVRVSHELRTGEQWNAYRR